MKLRRHDEAKKASKLMICIVFYFVRQFFTHGAKYAFIVFEISHFQTNGGIGDVTSFIEKSIRYPQSQVSVIIKCCETKY